jgi:hypothetical protein
MLARSGALLLRNGAADASRGESLAAIRAIRVRFEHARPSSDGFNRKICAQVLERTWRMIESGAECARACGIALYWSRAQKKCRVENLDFIGISAKSKQTAATRCVRSPFGDSVRTIDTSLTRIVVSCRRKHA